MTTTENTLPEWPAAPLPLHPQNAANEPVPLHQGPVSVHHGTQTTQGTGKLSLQWQPRTGLRLEMELEEDHLLQLAGGVRIDVAGGSIDVLELAKSQVW